LQIFLEISLKAAKNAKERVSIVEIHAAKRYLIDQFLRAWLK